MIPANYLRAQMHKPVNPVTREEVTKAHLLAENAELREQNAQLKREVKLMQAMQDLVDAKAARHLMHLPTRQVQR